MRSGTRAWAVLAVGGAGLACAGAGPVQERHEPTQAAEAPKVDAPPAPAAATPEVCCRTMSVSEGGFSESFDWFPLADCLMRDGERTRDDACGWEVATEPLLEETPAEEVCGYTHRRDGKVLLVERVTAEEATVTVDGVLRRLQTNRTPAYPAPPDAYTYEHAGVRVDVVRDEVHETAQLDVYVDREVEHVSTVTTFLPCGD